jgi:RNA polymerase sigma-70 factor, ECF subfamily
MCRRPAGRYGFFFGSLAVILRAMDSEARDHLEDEVELARTIASCAPGQARDAEARLYRRLAPRVRLYGLRHLRDDHAAADLVQQVLLRTIEKLRAGELREPERLVSFVFGVCRMTVLDLRRSHARHDRLLQRYGPDLAIADASVAPRLDHERVARCLERLPERERTVLLLTFYEERPADEVGGALGLSAGNVRVIRHRGLGRLRDCVTGGSGAP